MNMAERRVQCRPRLLLWRRSSGGSSCLSASARRPHAGRGFIIMARCAEEGGWSGRGRGGGCVPGARCRRRRDRHLNVAAIRVPSPSRSPNLPADVLGVFACRHVHFVGNTRAHVQGLAIALPGEMHLSLRVRSRLFAVACFQNAYLCAAENPRSPQAPLQG
jgi:hypothetical protein